LDPVTAAGAIAALGRSGLADAVPAVLAATSHPDAEVRTEAVSALGSLPGSRAVVDKLLELAPSLREARQSLSRLKGAEVAAILLEGAERGPEARRLACLEQFALRRQTEGLALLRQLRADPSAAVRGAAAAALGDLGPPADLALLTDWAAQAQDEGEQGRTLRAVVTLLQRHRTEQGLAGTFFSRLEQAPPEVARRLLPALVRLGTAEAAAVAGRLAGAPDATLAKAAVEKRKAEIDAVMDEFADRIPPSMREFYRRSAEAIGLDEFRRFAAAIPPIAGTATKFTKLGDSAGLTEAERSVAKQMGITEQEFVKAKKV
jgi:HEAT repeat protein